MRMKNRDKEVRSPAYQLAMDALRLAEKLNPGSLKTQRLLAKTEQHFRPLRLRIQASLSHHRLVQSRY